MRRRPRETGGPVMPAALQQEPAVDGWDSWDRWKPWMDAREAWRKVHEPDRAHRGAVADLLRFARLRNERVAARTTPTERTS